jgi:integrase
MTALVPTTGAVPAALDATIEQARAFYEAADSPNTRRAYQQGWAHFSAWCAARGLESLPAAPQALALYLTDHAGRLKVATLQQRLAAVARRHRDAGHESPTGEAVVRRVWRGIRRAKGVAPSRKAPVLTADIRCIVAGLGEDLTARRDRALLLIGFAGALRRSELVALDVADIEENGEGLVIGIHRSKTDQEGKGERIAVPRGGSPATCPVIAVAAWRAAAGIEEGPLFRPVGRGGRVGPGRLTDRSVALIVKRHVGRAGLDPSRYAGHSLRAGLITEAAVAGVAEQVIARQSRHRSVAVMRGYVREAGLFLRNAAAAVGL